MPQPYWMRRARAAIADRAEAAHVYQVRMSRHDRRAWASATTMADLGELVADWLEGRLQMTPGHLGPPDPETASLVPILAAVNRAGFITNGSQLAVKNTAQCYRCCARNTWVEGFATDEMLDRLRAMVARTWSDGPGLEVIACRGEDHGNHRLAGWAICPWDECTMFWGDGCPALRPEFRDCWYVLVQDPQPGRNTWLWPALEQFAEESSKQRSA